MSEVEKPQRRVRSFVRREGRLTPGQKKALDALLPQYGLPAPPTPLHPVEVFGREAPLTVEVGFGNGGALHRLALNDPERDFIGIEVHRPGVGRLLRAVSKDGLDNVRVSTHDAVEVLEQQLPAESVDRLLIFFPDPWPKKRHHKRRIVQPDFARLVARLLAPDGHLHLATDWEDYKEHMLEVLDACPELRNTAGPGGTVPRPDDRPITHFEERGRGKGHGVWDLVYTRAT